MNIHSRLKIVLFTTVQIDIAKESHMIDYLLVANRILKSKLGSDGRLIKYTDFERAILAKKQNKV